MHAHVGLHRWDTSVQSDQYLCSLVSLDSYDDTSSLFQATKCFFSFDGQLIVVIAQ